MYQANVTNLTNGEKKFYLGVTETSFKERFGNHRYSTELWKYVWELKNATTSPVIERSIVTKVLSKTQLNFCNYVSLRNSAW